MRITFFTSFLLALLTEPCRSQDGGWPAWPEWPPWQSSADEPEVMAVDVSVETDVMAVGPVPGVIGTGGAIFDRPLPILVPVTEVARSFPLPPVTEVASLPPVVEQFFVPVPTTEISEAAVTIVSTEEYSTIADFLNSRQDLSLFIDLISAAEIPQLFQAPGWYSTVFIPTNNAIAAAIDMLGFSSLDELAGIWIKTYHLVEYHALQEKLFSSDLEDGAFFKTVAGPGFNIQIDLSDGVGIIGLGSEAKVVEADIVIGDSVVHIIDTVLLPFDAAIDKEINEATMQVGEFSSLADFVANVPSLSTFGTVSEAAGAPLSTFKKGTAFIPTNSAFEDLLNILGVNMLEDLAQNQELLAQIVGNHFVLERQLQLDTEEDEELTTISRETIVFEHPFFTIVSDGSMANVLNFDILVGEVVVYIIDEVLLPFEVTDEILQQIQGSASMDG